MKAGKAYFNTAWGTSARSFCHSLKIAFPNKLVNTLLYFELTKCLIQLSLFVRYCLRKKFVLIRLFLWSWRCGKCRLNNVNVTNKGVDWECKNNIYWQNKISRLESLEIILEDNAEFEANNVTIEVRQFLHQFLHLSHSISPHFPSQGLLNSCRPSSGHSLNLRSLWSSHSVYL